MFGVEGSVWTLRVPFTNIAWDAHRRIEDERLEDIREALKEDVEATLETDDIPYLDGQKMSAWARLVLIANQIGEPDLAKKARDQLKPVVEKWLQGVNDDKFVYDQVCTMSIELQSFER